MATAPPNNTAKRSSERAPSNSFVLKTNCRPSFTLSHGFFSPRSFNGGLGFKRIMIKNAVKISDTITVSVPVFPSAAIKKPPIACPDTEADNHAPWFQAVAFCKAERGTTCASITLKTGPVNERMIPVQNMIRYTHNAIVWLCRYRAVKEVERNKRHAAAA